MSSRDLTKCLLALSVFCVITSPSIILAAINLFLAGYFTGVLREGENDADTETDTEVVVSAEKEEVK